MKSLAHKVQKPKPVSLQGLQTVYNFALNFSAKSLTAKYTNHAKILFAYLAYFAVAILIAGNRCAQIRLQFFRQFFRQAFWFFVNAGADVERFRFQNQFSVLLQNAVAEIQAHF